MAADVIILLSFGELSKITETARVSKYKYFNTLVNTSPNIVIPDLFPLLPLLAPRIAIEEAA